MRQRIAKRSRGARILGSCVGGRASTARPGMTAEIRLVPVTAANRALVRSLQLTRGQVDFVASNAESLDEAGQDEHARPRAVIADDLVVGFLMYEAPEDDDEARIYRLMIDRSCQGRGYGKAALRKALEEIGRLDHVRHISVCYVPENLGARHLYHSAGFVEHGLDEDGEMIADLVMPA